MKNNNNNNTRLQKVLRGLDSRGFDFQIALTYGEPGYTTEAPIIILGNWNHLSKGELKAVESVAEIEWSDEWIVDDDGRAFRCSPDSYGWEPSYFIHDGELVPYDTLPDDGEELGDALRDYGFTAEPGDRVLRAVPSTITREALLSFCELVRDDCETGFHPGQNDRPEKILENLPAGEYLFRIAGKGQFDVAWEVYRLKP